MDHWSENASQSDFSLFMDGFLYISSSQAKATLDRRGRDGESLPPPPNRSLGTFANDSNCASVKGPIQLSAAGSITVSPSAVEAPIV